MVRIASLLLRKTLMVASALLRKVPSTPLGPKPSMMSLVSLNGTVSGVGNILPCSKAMPRSKKIVYKNAFHINMVLNLPIWTSSAEYLSIKMLCMCLSPRPKMYPTIEEAAQDLKFFLNSLIDSGFEYGKEWPKLYVPGVC